MKTFISALAVILSFNAFGLTFVDRGDGVLEVSGTIVDSDYATFKDATADGKVKVVVFKNSRGGDVQTGNLIAYHLSSLKVETVVKGYCRSQCAITFLSGHKRRMDEGSYVGFHSAYRYTGGGVHWGSVMEHRRIFIEAAQEKYDDELMDLAANLPQHKYVVVSPSEPARTCTFNKNSQIESCTHFKNKTAFDFGILN